jgi:signal transduction histidine kinase
MNKKPEKDSRINIRHPLWLEYVIFLSIVLCLSGGQALIFFTYVDFSQVTIPPSAVLASVGYWALMTAVLCIFTAITRRRTNLRPMNKLGDAARRVAAGDFSVHIDPLRKDGKKDLAEVIFDDFNKMVEELDSTELMKNDFISNVSHEIKTPLATIRSYTTLSRATDISPEQRQEYSDTIMVAVQKLDTLVENILKLSKLENQRIVPRLSEFDLCRQLTDCAITFESLWESKNITFSAEMDDRAVVRADAELLEIVWNNLLSNALKFTEPGGAVTLTQTSDEDGITVSVSDTGCGMEDTTLNRIFDKFYQGDSSHSWEGNGLGLALALRVTELMSGQISAKSSPGEGSTLTVRLKAAP